MGLRTLDERNELVMQNTGLVGHVVHSMQRKGYFGKDAVEDMVQVGIVGLINAARLHDPTYLSKGRPCKFSTYACWAIYNEILREIQIQQRRVKVQPLCDERDLVEMSSYDFTRDIKLSMIDSVVARMPQRLRLIYQRRHVDGCTYDNLAAELGVSKERIRQLNCALLDKIKRAVA